MVRDFETEIAVAIEFVSQNCLLPEVRKSCSPILICQLAIGYLEGCSIKFNGAIVSPDIRRVCSEITHLSIAGCRTETKPEKPFPKKSILRGLWKKHWYQSSFLISNVASELKSRDHGSFFRGFKREYPLNAHQDGAEVNAAIRFAVDLKQRRGHFGGGPKMTGEWIVYKKLAERNLFLTLACHAEPEHDILARCNAALVDLGQEPLR